MTTIQRTSVLSRFSCLGDACEDTCCSNWSMQVDEATLDLYAKEAPELLDAVETSDGLAIMRKDPATHLCVKLDGGLCGIHQTHGERFLGDACYFYPRVTRTLGDQVVMTATMSCPEITRLALSETAPCTLEEINAPRLPHALKDYLPAGLQPTEALAIHQAFINATRDSTASAEQIFLRIASASRSLERIDIKSWPAMAAFYLSHADTRIPKPDARDTDPFNLLHALTGLIIASRVPASARLKQTIADMEHALAVTLDWQNVQIITSDQSLPAYQALQNLWREEAAAHYAPTLRNWLEMQMSLALYPFSGLGNSLTQRVTIIGVRLAIIRLALLCSRSMTDEKPPQDVVVRVIQSLSRFLDHLADPVFSMQIYAETGWVQESRMAGLLVK